MIKHKNSKRIGQKRQNPHWAPLFLFLFLFLFLLIELADASLIFAIAPNSRQCDTANQQDTDYSAQPAIVFAEPLRQHR